MVYVIIVYSDIDSFLLFVWMCVSEQFGWLFFYEVELLSENFMVKLCKLFGMLMVVMLKIDDGYQCYFYGIVCEVVQIGFEMISKVCYMCYCVQLVFKLWLFMCKVDCCIYIVKSVLIIVKDLFGEIGYVDVKFSFSGDYVVCDYCVQYCESMFDFIICLMEQEGIYYYFIYIVSMYIMVLVDVLGVYVVISGFVQILYCLLVEYGKCEVVLVFLWGVVESVYVLKYQFIDYDLFNLKILLLGIENIDDGSSFYGVFGLDMFDYFGMYVIVDDGCYYVQVWVEVFNVWYWVFDGQINVCGMVVGGFFMLKDFLFVDFNQEYLVIVIIIDLFDFGYYVGVEQGDELFQCCFEVIIFKMLFCNLFSVVKICVVGLQIVVVCGSDIDEEIVVDKYGCVQVMFYWNKLDKDKVQSFCLVCVVFFWVGKNWGVVSILCVGQEVVVSFLEGDLDCLLIIGSVYNVDNMLFYMLLDNKIQFGIKSCSLFGMVDDVNELCFEDKKGFEQFFIYVQKDMVEEVENDYMVIIDYDEISMIKNDQMFIVKYDQIIMVENNQMFIVNNDQIEMIKYDCKVIVQNGDMFDVMMNGIISIGQKFKFSVGIEIELVIGVLSIVMKSFGDIEIKGLNIKIIGDIGVKIEGQVEVGIKVGVIMDLGVGVIFKVYLDGMFEVVGIVMIMVKGIMILVKGDVMIQVFGGIIMIG